LPISFGGRYQGSSFTELLASDNTRLLPDWSQLCEAGLDPERVPHGTTVLAFKFSEGVIVAGDRLATEGHRVASRDIEKVLATDGYSLIAIAGAAGPALEMARLMRIELEHYEKIEGEPLELDGKANRLSQMVRANLPAAMQGMVVVPLFAGYDRRRRQGRLWKFDVTGGRYEETDYEATGSGGLYARESMKKHHEPAASRDAGLRCAVQALSDASDEDRATGGVDLERGIYPMVYFCTEAGIERAPDPEIDRIYREILGARRRPSSNGGVRR
jgi:proteasome beta subunit